MLSGVPEVVGMTVTLWWRGSPSPLPSPLGRGSMFGCAGKGSPAGERFRAAECCPLSLRERVRVRGNAASNCIGAAKGDGSGEGKGNMQLHRYGVDALRPRSEFGPRPSAFGFPAA